MGIVERLAHDGRLDRGDSAVRPGVNVVTAADPERDAPAVARDLDAELVGDEAALRAAIGVRAAMTAGPVGDEVLDELRGLAAALRRAERMRASTEENFREVMVQRIERTSGVAVHPASIRHAAQAILDAERDLAAASRAEDADPELFDDEELDARHNVVTAGVAFTVACLALGLVLAIVGVPVIAAAGVAVVGVALCATGTIRALRDAGQPAPSSPAEAAAPGRLEQANLALERTRAEERLRSATHRWEMLVGPRADPHDLDAVLRAHDPQFDLAAASAASPTMRAVDALQRRFAARWRVAWAKLGYAEPPGLDQLDAELARLRAGATRPLVLVEPLRWITVERLSDLLALLPDGTPVTFVQPGPDAQELAS